VPGKGKKAAKIADAAADFTVSTAGSALRLALRIVVLVLMVVIITALLFACIFAYYVKTELNQKLKVTLEDAQLSLSSTIFYTDAAGADHELQTLTSRENRIWVDYENLPAGMEHALVSSSRTTASTITRAWTGTVRRAPSPRCSSRCATTSAAPPSRSS
jgi:nitrogen fixation/metabolism regulation signal transduction histidine kinase